MTDTTIQITAAQILNRFADVDPHATCLCDLPDEDFVFGGRVDDITRAAGYDEPASKVIADQGAWGMTVADWAQTIGL